MQKIGIKKYKELLPVLYKNNISGIVYGGYGIGKTEIQKSVARSIAKGKNKIYIEWNEITNQKKMEIEHDPEPYFVNAIVHLAQFDSVDLHGLPNLSNKDYTVWSPIRVIKLFSRENASGIFFLDEYPQSREDVQKASTQLIRDRQMGDIPLNKNVFVFAAGNREEDNSGAMPLLEHVKDRFVEMEIAFDKQYYIGDPKKGTGGFFEDRLESALYIFLQYDSSWLYKVDNAKKDKAVTPRGIMERANVMLKEFKNNPEMWYDALAISVGEGFASSFMSWYRIRKNLDVEKILNDPTQVRNLDVGALYSLIYVLYSKYKDNYKLFNKIIDVIAELDQNREGAYVMTLLKKMKTKNPVGFKKIIKHPAWKNSLAKTYADFMDV